MCQASIVALEDALLLKDDLPPFGGWGLPLPTLPRRAWAYLEQVVGPGRDAAALSAQAIEVAPSRLTPQLVDDLEATGAQVRADDDARLRHVGGMSYRDLLAQRSGQGLMAPDAIAFPTSHEQVQALLEVCVRENLAVVPFGGGTSVVGGLVMHPGHHRAVVALSTSRLDRIISLDETSGLVHLQAGMRGPRVEAELAARGFTLGHFPQSFERASIGGYAATGSSGQASTGFGRFGSMVHALRMATPQGTWELGRAPASAAGPALISVALGSEGALGVITELQLRVQRRAGARLYEAAMAPSFDAGIEAFRRLAQAGVPATVMRLSDHRETVATLMMGGHDDGSDLPGRLRHRLQDLFLRQRGFEPARQRGALIVLGWEASTRALLRTRRRTAWDLMRSQGVRGLGQSGGRAWERGRFTGPALRDLLLDRGYLVETLESATTWAKLTQLHESVRTALTEALAADGCASLVMVHVSHVYATGASLYWTVLAQSPPDPGEAAQVWWRAKSAAMRAIVEQEATITHHHAVGRDHGPWVEDEIGPLGRGVLAAVKQRLDPTRIMNPGADLFP